MVVRKHTNYVNFTKCGRRSGKKKLNNKAMQKESMGD